MAIFFTFTEKFIMSPKQRFVILFALVSFSLGAQDTTWVQSLTFKSKTRDTTVLFPNGDHNQYEKILMYYTMRCKGGLISTSSDRNRGCGEWDYSCNTNIIDSTGIDSTKAIHPNYVIAGFGDKFLPFVSSPTYTYNEYNQTLVNIQNTNNTIKVPLGVNADIIMINKENLAGKFWLYYSKEELSTFGNGIINGIVFKHNGSGTLDRMTVKVTEYGGPKITLDEVQNLSYEEVVKRSISFSNNGETIIYFHKGYNYSNTADGLLFEISYQTSENNINNLEVKGSQALEGTSFGTLKKDYYLESGSLGGGIGKNEAFKKINKEITVAFWSFGNEAVLPNNNSIFHATGTKGERQLNVHLPWSNSKIFWDCGGDNSGFDRIEKNANTSDFEGKWNHWAFTKNTNTGSMKIYLNGKLWHSGSAKTKPINIEAFTLGGNEDNSLPYFGNIDDFTIWNRELTLAEIVVLMTQNTESITNSKTNLIANYDMNKVQNDVLPDLSDHKIDLKFGSKIFVKPFLTNTYFKDFKDIGLRPNIDLIKGQISLQKTETTYRDSIENTPLKITPYSVENRKLIKGTPFYYWEAKPQLVFNEDQVQVGEIEIVFEDILEIQELTYYNFSPAKYEIMSFVTPYGIGLNLGAKGKTWIFDMTDYGPILKDKKRLLLDKGGEFQEEMDIKFAFIKGKPTRNVLSIQQVWPVNMYGYTDILSNRHLEPRDLKVEADVKSMKVKTMATGHGQEGEFISRTHQININGGAVDFSYPLWKECADNPIYPQGGTWVYDRAGWCPGAPTDLREFEIMNLVQGNKFSIDYGINTATGDSRYIVNTQVVKYGPMNFANDAAIVEIQSPSERVEFGRVNPACANPTILIRNNGSSTINTLSIRYGTQNASKTYDWTGSLSSLKDVKLVLPSLLPSEMNNGSVFFAEIVSVNGSGDENVKNNKMTSKIVPVRVFEKGIIVSIKTNGAPNETKWTLKDSDGKVIKSSRPNMDAFTIYNDTIANIEGCYQLQFTDSDQDGISWWANGDGDGYIRAKGIGLSWLEFEPDFGTEYTVNFIAGSVNNITAENSDLYVQINPNPTQGKAEVIYSGLSGDLKLEVLDNQGRLLFSERTFNINDGEQRSFIDLDNVSPGLYFVRLSGNKISGTYKLIKI